MAVMEFLQSVREYLQPKREVDHDLSQDVDICTPRPYLKP